tara:strand:+ start:4249 stop:5553 length:1305 start_codon:yes stop_codon:yes gene_type:complete
MSTHYGLDSEFERIVAALLVTRPKFYKRIIKQIDPASFQDEGASLVASLCRSFKKPPGSPTIVKQRARRRLDKGKFSEDEYEAVVEFLYEIEQDEPTVSSEDVLQELVPVLRRRMEKEALDQGLKAFTNSEDLSAVGDMLNKAYRLGAVESTLGTMLSPAIMDQIEELRNIRKLPTGVDELDAALGGGLERGSLGVYVGPTGAGKSMSLSHTACDAISNKLNVAYATLELGEEYVYARIVSNLTDLAWEDILNNSRAAKKARTRLQELEEQNLLGFCTVKYFTPHAVTVSDIRDWVADEEENYGKKIDIVCVDYAALLHEPSKKMKHEELTSIAEQLRAFAADKKCWVWTAAQSKAEAQDKRTKKIDSQHTAGSMGIPRTADLVITLNPRDEGATMMFRVAKNRYGRSGEDIGPLPQEFEKGRVAPLIREGWPF